MSAYDPERHHRRSIRLKGYDYTQPAAYFVTICTHERAHLFGRVVDGEMVLNELGRIVWEEWFRSAEIRAEIELFADEFVVMPNHIHGIVWIVGATGLLSDVRLHPLYPPWYSTSVGIVGFSEGEGDLCLVPYRTKFDGKLCNGSKPVRA